MDTFDEDAFMQRVDQLTGIANLAVVHEEFMDICQYLSEEKKLKFIQDYAARIKRPAASADKKIISSDRPKWTDPT